MTRRPRSLPRPRALGASLTALLCAGLGGCALGVEHMLGTDGPYHQHAWHQWPARTGMFLVTVPMTVVVAPLALLEQALTGNSLFEKQRPGVTSYLVGVPATVGAYATGLPFWTVGLPWEFGAAPADQAPPAPVDDPDAADDGADG